jgi:hypothetical protein
VLNSRKSPTARNILFNDASREVRAALGVEGVFGGFILTSYSRILRKMDSCEC